MILVEVLEANRRFAAGSRPAPAGAQRRLVAVLSCIESRLGSFLEPALGLERGEAFVVRNAGAWVNADALRSLAVAVYARGATEIFLVGHSDCALARFDTAPFLDSLKSHGIPRSAIPDMDLRGWLGMFGSLQDHVSAGVDALKASPLLSGSVPVHGLILDLDSGLLTVVRRGDEALKAAAVPAAAVSPAASLTAAAPTVSVPPLEVSVRPGATLAAAGSLPVPAPAAAASAVPEAGGRPAQKVDVWIQDPGLYPEDVVRLVGNIVGQHLNPQEILKAPILAAVGQDRAMKVKAFLEKWGARILIRRAGS